MIRAKEVQVDPTEKGKSEHPISIFHKSVQSFKDMVGGSLFIIPSIIRTRGVKALKKIKIEHLLEIVDLRNFSRDAPFLLVVV